MRWRRLFEAALLVVLGSTPPATALAQTEAELAAARSLFAEALHDEQAGRLAVALEKFRRVKEVRNTAPIEYRIATCEEGLGRLVSASSSYASAIALAGESPGNEAVAAAARDRLSAVQARVGHLTLDTTAAAVPRSELLVDGSPASSQGAIPVDPGPHMISARAPGAAPFQREVVMPEGGMLTVPVVLQPEVEVAPPKPRTAGWITLGAGGALVAASGTLLVLRQIDINTLNANCPTKVGMVGVCKPGSDRTSLESTRNRALAEGPVAAVLGGVGVLAAGVGLYLLIRAPRQESTPIALRLVPPGLAVEGSF